MLASFAPIMDRLRLLARAATRTRAINQLFGTSMTPSEIDRAFADEDIELLILWKEGLPSADG